jgi:putative ABC transport system permease protein
MNLYNLIRTAWYSLRAYKLRIFLTMIGIIIGIASVSAILAIGEGLKAEASRSVESANLNKVTVNYEPGPSEDSASVTAFKESDLDQLAQIEGVQEITTNESESEFFNMNVTEIRYFDRASYVEVAHYSDEDKSRELTFGRNLTDDEGRSSRRVIILGYETAEELFRNPEEAIGKGVQIGDSMFEVIGVAEKVAEETEFEFRSLDDIDPNSSLVPADVIFEQENAGEEIWNISVSLAPGSVKDEVMADVKDKLYELNPDIEGEYEEFDLEEIIDTMQSVINNITMFVVFVTGISLLVGGIGVMNIMYVSVTERKREIGIRRAIGAKPKNILFQFLIEAIFITGIGGLIGIAFGYLLSLAVGSFIPFPPVMTVRNFLAASSISVLTGLVFGIIPATKAAKLDPIKAIYK